MAIWMDPKSTLAILEQAQGLGVFFQQLAVHIKNFKSVQEKRHIFLGLVSLLTLQLVDIPQVSFFFSFQFFL
jgi:hypothetical protein